MKINTKETVKDLQGKAIPFGKEGDFTIGQAISNILVDAKEGGRMKMFILAQKFFNDKEVDVDEVDLNLIKGAVEKTEQYNNLVNGQILLFIDGLKEEKKK